jgi:tetratricopeptide (TPR) repeat protein
MVFSEFEKEDRLQQVNQQDLSAYRHACELNPETFEPYYQLGQALNRWRQLKLESLHSNPCSGALSLLLLKEKHGDGSEIVIAELNDNAFLRATNQLNDEGFVKEAYRAYLKREPEAGAKESYPRAIGDGALSRKMFISNVRHSREFQVLLAQYGQREEEIAGHWRAIEIKQEHLEEEIACYRRAIELNPNFDKLHYHLGKALTNIGSLDAAASAYRRAIEINHHSVWSYVKLAQVLAKQAKPDEASIYRQKATELIVENSEKTIQLTFPNEANESKLLKLKKEDLVIRYSVLFDPLNDIGRGIQLSCSLLSLKLYLFPYVPYHLVFYTAPKLCSSIRAICTCLDIPASTYSFIYLNDEEDRKFSEDIHQATPTDRICIRRMLADFRELPSDNFRLLLGSDCYFFSPPHELIAFAWSSTAKFKVIYAVDNFTFSEKLYSVPYWQANVLAGLLGDFYCLAPGVSLSRASIVGCLKLIDNWPSSGRLIPGDRFVAHACEQIAAAILLAQFPSRALPDSLYVHWVYKPGCVMLHGKNPDNLLSVMPSELAKKLVEYWELLGYRERGDVI